MHYSENYKDHENKKDIKQISLEDVKSMFYLGAYVYKNYKRQWFKPYIFLLCQIYSLVNLAVSILGLVLLYAGITLTGVVNMVTYIGALVVSISFVRSCIIFKLGLTSYEHRMRQFRVVHRMLVKLGVKYIYSKDKITGYFPNNEKGVFPQNTFTPWSLLSTLDAHIGVSRRR